MAIECAEIGTAIFLWRGNAMRLNDNYRMNVVSEYWASGMTQEEFCRSHPKPVTPRALRSWTRLAEAKDPSGRVSQVLDRAISEMEKLRASVTPAPPKPARPASQDHEDPRAQSGSTQAPARPAPRAMAAPPIQKVAIAVTPPEPQGRRFTWD